MAKSGKKRCFLAVLWSRIHWSRIQIQHFKWIRIRIQSGSRVLMTKNFRKKYNWTFFFKSFLYQKLQFTYPLGLYKGGPSCRRSLQPSKENTQHYKKWNYSTFSIFVGLFYTPGSGCESGYGSRDPIESGSTTLLSGNRAFFSNI